MKNLLWFVLLSALLLACLNYDAVMVDASTQTLDGANYHLSHNLNKSRVGWRAQSDQQKESQRAIRKLKPEAEVKFRNMRAGKPPLQYLSFDVVLRNRERSARWFLLPSNLGSGHGPIGEAGGVDALETYSPRGNGRVIIGRFLGTGGFSALLLPGNAEIRLRQFPISFWGELPDSLEIEVVIAKTLKIGDQTAESWFGPRPMSSVKADITEDAEDVRRMHGSKRTPDNKEVRTVTEGVRRVKLQVSLEK